MRIIASLAVVVGLALCGSPAGAQEEARRVAAGDYVEVDEQGVPNSTLAVKVHEVTPNILEARGANGWVVYASYDAAQKEYRGFFEWQKFGPYRSPAGKWADLYQIRLSRQDGGQFRIDGKSKDNEFVIRAAPKP